MSTSVAGGADAGRPRPAIDEEEDEQVGEIRGFFVPVVYGGIRGCTRERGFPAGCPDGLELLLPDEVFNEVLSSAQSILHMHEANTVHAYTGPALFLGLVFGILSLGVAAVFSKHQAAKTIWGVCGAVAGLSLCAMVYGFVQRNIIEFKKLHAANGAVQSYLTRYLATAPVRAAMAAHLTATQALREQAQMMQEAGGRVHVSCALLTDGEIEAVTGRRHRGDNGSELAFACCLCGIFDGVVMAVMGCISAVFFVVDRYELGVLFRWEKALEALSPAAVADRDDYSALPVQPQRHRHQQQRPTPGADARSGDNVVVAVEEDAGAEARGTGRGKVADDPDGIDDDPSDALPVKAVGENQQPPAQTRARIDGDPGGSAQATQVPPGGTQRVATSHRLQQQFPQQPYMHRPAPVASSASAAPQPPGVSLRVGSSKEPDAGGRRSGAPETAIGAAGGSGRRTQLLSAPRSSRRPAPAGDDTAASHRHATASPLVTASMAAKGSGSASPTRRATTASLAVPSTDAESSRGVLGSIFRHFSSRPASREPSARFAAAAAASPAAAGSSRSALAAMRDAGAVSTRVAAGGATTVVALRTPSGGHAGSASVIVGTSSRGTAGYASPSPSRSTSMRDRQLSPGVAPTGGVSSRVAASRTPSIPSTAVAAGGVATRTGYRTGGGGPAVALPVTRAASGRVVYTNPHRAALVLQHHHHPVGSTSDATGVPSAALALDTNTRGTGAAAASPLSAGGGSSGGSPVGAAAGGFGRRLRNAEQPSEPRLVEVTSPLATTASTSTISPLPSRRLNPTNRIGVTPLVIDVSAGATSSSITPLGPGTSAASLGGLRASPGSASARRTAGGTAIISVSPLARLNVGGNTTRR